MATSNSPAGQLITENIDIWTSAIKKRGSQGRGSSKKIELYGIKKLRELILELAVRGLLVPQDPNDEPASVLLEKIAAEKEQLIKDGKIKKQKALPAISKDEKPFELPNGWEWVRLRDIGYTQTGSTPKKSDANFYGEGVPYIKPGDISEGIIKSYENDGLTNEGAKALGRLAPSDSILMVCIGTIGKCARVDRQVSFNQQINSVTPYLRIGRFIEKVLQSAYFQKLAWATSSSTTLSILNKGRWESLPVAISPASEQPRIVAKVDELMALCDQLEQQTETSLLAHQTLVETLLNTLLNADQNSFDQAWERIAQHFDILFTTEHSIDQLKQTILQLAVMGKLVPQDPNDEPASVLLEKIAAEKEQLIKDKKIKKHPPVEPIGDIKELPASWENIVVQDFADISLGSTPNRAEVEYWNGDIPWVSSGEVVYGVIKDTSEKITKAGFENSSTSLIPARSLLMAIIGQGKTRGQSALLGIDACTNQNVAAFVFNEEYVVPEFVWIWAQSKYDSHRGDGHGGAQPALNGKKVRSFRFPLPPVVEQQRIIAKVNELIVLCDSLETQLCRSQATQLYLADAMAEKALN